MDTEQKNKPSRLPVYFYCVFVSIGIGLVTYFINDKTAPYCLGLTAAAMAGGCSAVWLYSLISRKRSSR